MVIAGVAWLPLLLLALIGGDALGGSLWIPFLYDIEAQVRFLIALSNFDRRRSDRPFSPGSHG
jgi:hypothetical protein